MHPLYGALPVPYVPGRIIRGALVAHGYTCGPHCRSSQYSRTFISTTASSGTILPTLCSILWDGGFQEQGQCFFIGLSCANTFCLLLFSPFLYFLSIGWYCGTVVFGLIRCILPSPSPALLTYFNNNNNKKTSSLQQYGYSRRSFSTTLVDDDNKY